MSGWLFPILLGTFGGLAVDGAAPIALQISTETAPAGGFAQIKIYAAKPVAISNGHLVLNLDATAFGPSAIVGLFGANGDATGTATTSGSQIDVQFSSATSGIGQLAGLPVLVISVPVLASASGRVVLSATSPDSSVTVASGSVTVQGTLSVQKIYAGMGVVAAGTVVPVYGSGFTASTTVTIDGVEISAIKFVSSGEVDVTVGGAAELVGKLARVTDSGVEFDYFCFQPNDPVNFPGTMFASSVASVQPLFPLFAANAFKGQSGPFGGVIEVQNPNPMAAMVSLGNFVNGAETNGVNLSLPPGTWGILEPSSNWNLDSSLPVRVVPLSFCGSEGGPPVCLSAAAPYNTAAAPLTLVPSSLSFAWQVGSPNPPEPQNVLALGTQLAITRVPASEPWLLPSLLIGTGGVSVIIDPVGLAVGTYQGSITISQGSSLVTGPPATLPVTLTVTSAPVPIVSAKPSAGITFTVPSSVSTPYSQTIAVTSDTGPTPFTVNLPQGTWLKVTPTGGTTPATLTVTWDPGVTAQINYPQRSLSSSILISGLSNSVTVPATFNFTGVQTYQTYLGASGQGPNGLVFSGPAGSPAQTQIINVDPPGTISAAASQPWMTLSAPTSGSGGNQTVVVTVNPFGLAAGVYTGTVTISEAGLAPIAVPVTLGVYGAPPALTITNSSFTFVQTAGEPPIPFQTAEVDSGGVPVPLLFSSPSVSWLQVADPGGSPTPAPISVGLANPPGSPGEYSGSFTIQSPGQSINVPVKLLVEPGPATPPVISQVVNSASGIAGGVSPGEILTIRGYSVGAPAAAGLKLDASGSVLANLNGLQVTFDGKAAPLVYTSSNQTNLIVPYEVAGRTSTVMQVTYAAAAPGTAQPSAWVLPVVAAAPGVFTIDATGTGQGAIVNQDGTVNSAANPAAGGSIVSIYATGEGQTTPAGVTGSVTGSALKLPVLPVTVTFGGVNAAVQYAGSAPGAIAGLLQINAVVPQDLFPGPAVPIVVSVGAAQSQAVATIAVK